MTTRSYGLSLISNGSTFWSWNAQLLASLISAGVAPNAVPSSIAATVTRPRPTRRKIRFSDEDGLTWEWARFLPATANRSSIGRPSSSPDRRIEERCAWLEICDLDLVVVQLWRRLGGKLRRESGQPHHGPNQCAP